MILLIDGYNTSKKCCNCWNNVENVCINKKSLFCLLKCYTCNECNFGSHEDKKVPKFHSNKYLTRDKNNCINMLSIINHIIYKKNARRNSNWIKINCLYHHVRRIKNGISVVFTCSILNLFPFKHSMCVIKY